MLNPNFKMTLHDLVGAPVKNGDLGVELECEGDYLPTAITGWTIKAEGSLRGRNGRTIGPDLLDTDTPREYVLSRPLPYRGLEAKLENLEAALRLDKRTVVRLTPRASTHIHLNYGSRTFHELLAFILVFMCAEPVLLRLCGPQRNGNLFCLPTYEAGDWPEIIRGIVSEPRYNWPSGRKYSSLNIDPIVPLGSVEVRCFPNSVTPSDILSWATWLLNMRTIAEGADETYESMIARITNEPNRFILNVFEHADVLRACYPTNPADLVLFGAEQAYEVWREMRPLWDWSEDQIKIKVTKADMPAPVAPRRRGLTQAMVNQAFEQARLR